MHLLISPPDAPDSRAPIPLDVALDSSTRLLGIFLDARMTTSKHIAHAATRAKDEVATLAPMRSWVDPQAIRELYCAHALSTLTYAAPCLFVRPTHEVLFGDEPFSMELHCPVSTWEQLEIIHRQACRYITHAVATASNAAVVRLAGFRSLKSTTARLALRAWASDYAVDEVPGVWPGMGALPLITSAPVDHVHIYQDITPGVTRDSPSHVRRADNLRRLWRAAARRQIDVMVYTDGSVVDRDSSGSAAVFRRPRSGLLQAMLGFDHGEDDTVIELHEGGSTKACSFSAETTALSLALEHLMTRTPAVAEYIKTLSREHRGFDRVHVGIPTDARGLLQSLMRGPTTPTGAPVARLWHMLQELRPYFEVSFIFFFGHAERTVTAAAVVPPPGRALHGHSSLSRPPVGASQDDDDAEGSAYPPPSASDSDEHEPPEFDDYDPDGAIYNNYDSDAATVVDANDLEEAVPEDEAAPASSTESEDIPPLPPFVYPDSNEVADVAAERARRRCDSAPESWWKDAARYHTRDVQKGDDAAARSGDGLRFFPPRASAPVKLPRDATAKTFRTICRLRSGAIPCFALYEEPGPCPLCGAANGTGRGGVGVNHLFVCEALKEQRRLFGVPANTMKALWPSAGSRLTIHNTARYAERAINMVREQYQHASAMDPPPVE
jgi:hypothetical protein